MILTAILTMAVVAKAQHEEGDFMVQPKVGLNIATLSDADKAITDLHFGIEAEYMVTDNFSLGLGAILSNQGAKYDYYELNANGEDSRNKYTVDLDYVHVPILASYYVLPGLAVKAGVQPGFKMRAKAKIDDRTVDLDELYKVSSYVLDEDIKVSKFDLSIPVGISYEYKNIVLDARYNWGLVKVMNVGDAFYNRCFMVSLGYKLQLGD
jgi:hypothetical protein